MKYDIEIYHNETEDTLPMIAWGAQDRISGHIRRGRTPEEALWKLLADLESLEIRGVIV